MAYEYVIKGPNVDAVQTMEWLQRRGFVVILKQNQPTIRDPNFNDLSHLYFEDDQMLVSIPVPNDETDRLLGLIVIKELSHSDKIEISEN